ncbi:MAG: serine hydrolase domain-containing protein [Caulobacteraceae bacterium]
MVWGKAARSLALIGALTASLSPAFAQVPPRVAAASTTAPTATQAPSAPYMPAASARLAPGTPIPAAELETFIDGVMAQAMPTEHIAGAAVSVVQNGQVVLLKGYGVERMSPAKPVDPSRTLFRIGSITKTFTWIALMREVEAGRIRLNAPVNIYLPQKLQVPDEGFKKDILVRDLMTHSPGFEDRALGQLFEKDPKRIRPLETYLRQERPARVREPGTFPTYSNYGVGLAGEALAPVTGKPFQTLAEQWILNPLGMTRTTFREPYPARADLPAPMNPRLAAAMSSGFRWTAAGYQTREFEYVTGLAPAGSGSSTAADMAKYMTAIMGNGAFNGATIYSPIEAQAFRTTLFRAAPGVPGWQHGFMEYSLPGGYTGYGHGGATLYFHSNMVTVPALNLGVFISTNTDTGRALARRLPALIVQRFYAAPTLPAAGSKALLDHRAAYEGRYLTTRRAYRGLEKFVDLFQATATVAVTPEGRLLTREGAETRLWVPTADPAVFRDAAGPERVVFHLNHGKADRWYASSGTTAYERAGPLTSMGLLGLLAALTAVSAVASIVGAIIRRRRDLRETSIQRRASLVQTTASILWLISMIAFVVWASKTSDIGAFFYSFPGVWLTLGSACAFVAAILSAIALALTAWAWIGGRRLDSWTLLRKLMFTATNVWFAAFAVMLALWGALEPWGG